MVSCFITDNLLAIDKATVLNYLFDNRAATQMDSPVKLAHDKALRRWIPLAKGHLGGAMGFFVVNLNKLLNEQSSCLCYETS